MKKYSVFAVCENGAVEINRKGETEGFDTFEDAKAVAEEHKSLGAPIHIVFDGKVLAKV